MANTGSGYEVAEQVINEAAKDITNTQQDVQADINMLRRNLEALNGQWEGAGGNAFRGAIAHWEQTANKVLSAMTDFHSALTSSDQTYTATEGAVTQRLNKYNNAL